MDFYEILMLALAAAQLVIQIAQLLFQRRNDSARERVSGNFLAITERSDGKDKE